MVVSLGRLGMREFDLASDADLVFVIPDEDAAEQAFWTAVAERMIHAISAYTGDGVMFTVDTRLRPNGREGALVQSEGDLSRVLRQARRGLGGHRLHEIARGGREPGARHRVPARTAGTGLAALRAKRPVAQGTGANARAPGEGAGLAQSAESRPSAATTISISP